jgi:predicted MFS family arabinose efflux permease
VIIALFFIKTYQKPKEKEEAPFFQRFREGYQYAFGFPPIRFLLILIALVSLMGMPYTVLMPVFARDILHGNSNTLGLLMAFVGIGALIGAYYLASRKSVLGLGRMIVVATTLFGLGIIGFSQSRIIWLSFIILAFTGFGMITQMSSTNTILQTIAEEDKRGRVMSFYTLSFMGMVPFGSLLAGFLSSRIGAPMTLVISGVACLIGAFIFSRKLPDIRKHVRPIYQKLGILEG